MKAEIKVAKPHTRKAATKKTAVRAIAAVAKVQPVALATKRAVAAAPVVTKAKPVVAKTTPVPVKAKMSQDQPAARKLPPPKAVSPIMRDSFTMTTADQELLKKCKLDAIKSGRDSTKKSEVVRAALRHFASLAPATQLMELNQLDPVKTGRPKKQKK